VNLAAAQCRLPTAQGEFRLLACADPATGLEHAALLLGNWTDRDAVLVRVHSECLTGDVLGSLRCDCGAQWRAAQAAVGDAGCGVLLYLRQEGRGIGFLNKVRAYALQDAGADTVDANRHLGLPDDARDYGFAAALLRDLGVRRVRLMTNNPVKVTALQAGGLEVVERIALHVGETGYNQAYLQTKRRRMGHLGPG
jgi:GTP cyclohydrolase II